MLILHLKKTGNLVARWKLPLTLVVLFLSLLPNIFGGRGVARKDPKTKLPHLNLTVYTVIMPLVDFNIPRVFWRILFVEKTRTMLEYI